MNNVPDIRGHLPRAYRIERVIQETPFTRSLVLRGRMAAAPGQFVMAWLPDLDEKPFSISAVEPLMLTIDRVGPFTEAMHALQPGDRLWLRGPFGRGFTLTSDPLLLIGGGCGAAPLHLLACEARTCKVDVVLGARSAERLFFQDRFARLGCAVYVATDDGSTRVAGTSVDLARHLLSQSVLHPNAIYACGPEPMLEAVYRLARSYALPCQLSYEAYMRCGIGVCGSCSVGGCLVCRDGPVFDRPPRQLRDPHS